MTSQNMGRPTGNKYKVPKAAWRKWTNHGRKVFNDVYEGMKPQAIIVHPDAVLLPAKQWQTVRWNAAFLAAVAASKLKGKLTFNPREFT